jgi:hypothetical protein
MPKVPQTLLTLTDDLIDYAGLFPPAALNMSDSVSRYMRYLQTDEAPMLGRFICRASQLAEMSKYAGILMPGTAGTSGYREMSNISDPWRVSVVVDGTLDEALDAIDTFDERHSVEDNGLAKIDAIEIKVNNAQEIDDIIEGIPDDLLPFFEVPVNTDVRGMIAAIAGESAQGGAAAKMRCGGITPEAIPTSEQIAAFVHACALGDVKFKATAGLHHPVRAEQALTYEANPPRAVMHGFLNVFLAAAFVKHGGMSLDATIDLLNETDPSTFVFTDQHAAWRDTRIGLIDLARSRESFALSFGSCSFEEPVADLRTLGYL